MTEIPNRLPDAAIERMMGNGTFQRALITFYLACDETNRQILMQAFWKDFGPNVNYRKAGDGVPEKRPRMWMEPRNND